MKILTGLLIVACYVLLLAIWSAGSESSREGLEKAFGGLFAIALWILILLTMLITLGNVSGKTPLTGIVFMLVFFSGYISFKSLDLAWEAKWLLIIPLTNGLLLTLYVTWLNYAGDLSHYLPSRYFEPVIVSGLIIFSLLPIPALKKKSARDAKNVAELKMDKEKWELEHLAKQRAENLEKFKKLNSDSHIHEWLNFVDKDNELRNHAFDSIKKLEHKQEQVEHLLEYRIPLALMEVSNFGVELTPTLCRYAQDMLMAEVAPYISGNQSEYQEPFGGIELAKKFNSYFTSINWLVNHGCDCSLTLDAFETAAKLYVSSPESSELIGKIRQLKKDGADLSGSK